ncbi:glutamine synthetase family protein [Pseudomonas aeruginosa]|uniref:glutamine synthetase family protein n=1 Tax=Pseudomonas aeruginosa TaxID=287 RepID=UPI0005EBB137|nr:glutamine synthetase family protein [Pseudomonas aeruginosa]
MSVPLRAVQLTEPSLFLQEHPEVQFVDLLISDMNGVVRGKRIERNSLPKVFEKGINLPASLFALDITGSTVESTGLGLDIGDADRICYPIPGTLSMEPWQKRPTAQLLMTMHELEGDPFFADPREVLRQVVARFTEMELTIVAESAPAQFEVNLHHVADPMKACDYAVLLKRLIKNIAYDHEMDTTFMAKPYPGQAGNGLHVHISLLDKHGNNIFTSEDPEQNAALCHAIGGVLETLPASMAFLCPNVNSYRRFGSQFYVPNAPSWGLDNRTVALRVPTGSPDAVRLEHRVAGADANPYLLLASVLAGVHHGLTNKVEPGAPIEGNSYEQLEPSLPNNLRDALRELDDSEILAKYIDPKYIDIFVACKESELEEFEYSISDLEYNWYLHTV